ncbi:hypothetical protein JTE90_009412 [Oedothorax gibbosus]|uniref:Uncharacterized protein n=1 Tax=Oedothorax gibbosus TaxID=931172 RepID=A0AAV6VSE9_9ARAC|nr:hypothetical protein JTE90_009412 [Oedothorax gibbosus]
MRREEYDRTYGRRSHYPPPMPPPQEDPRSRRSRTKMKCLISIGLILPALAAVIGVAAWAVSADVVMNSGNNNRGVNKADHNMMQNFASENENRRDIFRTNEDNQKFHVQPQSPTSSSTTTTTTTTTQSTTTTSSTTTTPAPVTLSAQEETDVNAILSKLISASGAVSGGSGPRFVVVAPLPDNSEAGQNPPSPISRVDSSTSTKTHSRDDGWHVSGQNRPEQDLMPAASSQNTQRYQITMGRSTSSQSNQNEQNSKSDSSAATRRIGTKPYMMSASSSNAGGGFNNHQIDLTGFEPFDTMIHDFQASQKVQHNPQPNFQPQGSFTNKRGPPQGHFNTRNHHKHQPMQQFDSGDQHIFHHHIPEHNVHGLQGSPNHPQGVIAPPPPGVGLKPIQQQMHHIDPMQGAESNRWGTVGFHPPPPSFHHKPPEGISLSISSPANSGTHVSVKEPVSVIKSFFLPFLPKPRLNMNARVVFGVVLDKGMGIGADKKKFH